MYSSKYNNLDNEETTPPVRGRPQSIAGLIEYKREVQPVTSSTESRFFDETPSPIYKYSSTRNSSSVSANLSSVNNIKRVRPRAQMDTYQFGDRKHVWQ